MRGLLGDRAHLVPPVRQRASGRNAEVYIHEMPGGQYTNLREQAESMGRRAWQEIAHTYAEVKFAFGDIVKVTPLAKLSAIGNFPGGPRHDGERSGTTRP